MNRPRNLLAGLARSSAGELVETLFSGGACRVERIVSTGQASPPGFWYDQPEDEWVLLLAGSAALLFEDEPEAVSLRPGDALHIPAHRRHRIEWTDPAAPTVWLAIHFRPPAP